MSRSPFRIRRLLAGVTIAVLAVTAPQTAYAASTGHVHTEDHAMGSQIAKHQPAPTTRSTGPRTLAETATVEGLDVSSHNGGVDWASYWNQGKRFAWVKATEGNYYTNNLFSDQYGGSYQQGFLRGAYHFAIPNASSGADQASYFSNQGGGWSADGKTLPGALDLEWNPNNDGTGDCYGLTQAQMGAWITDFSNTYKTRWNKYPIIYTGQAWWDECVGSAATLGSTNPLWTARYGTTTAGALPTGWSVYTIWQYSKTGYDHDTFNGSTTQLQKLAATKDA